MDKIVWHHSPNGVYSVKSTYHLAGQLVAGGQAHAKSPWKSIWRVRIPPKVRNFYWRLCKGWLAIRTKLRKWYATMEVTCPLCNQMPETLWHLFVDCVHARNCWIEGNLWPKIDRLCYQEKGATDLFLSLSRHLDQNEMERAMMIAWAIWRARNNAVWNDTRETPSHLIYAAMTTLVEWQQAHENVRERQGNTGCQKWHRPCMGFVKVNVDAVFFDDTLETGIGMVIHDDSGEFIFYRSLVRSGVMKVDEGEAWGVVEAVRWAMNLGFRRVLVESDSQRVVTALKNTASGENVHCDYIEEGRNLLKAHDQIKITWVCRNVNTLAHVIARTSRDFNSPYCWVELPAFVDGLLD